MTQLALDLGEDFIHEYICREGFLTRSHGQWEERDFHGYRQTRYQGEPWRFFICGFCGPRLSDGSDSIGHVLMWDGTETACQMDTKGRLKINGRWYDYDQWDH